MKKIFTFLVGLIISIQLDAQIDTLLNRQENEAVYVSSSSSGKDNIKTTHPIISNKIIGENTNEILAVKKLADEKQANQQEIKKEVYAFTPEEQKINRYEKTTCY
jgi:hypothetical protein